MKGIIVDEDEDEDDDGGGGGNDEQIARLKKSLFHLVPYTYILIVKAEIRFRQGPPSLSLSPLSSFYTSTSFLLLLLLLLAYTIANILKLHPTYRILSPIREPSMTTADVLRLPSPRRNRAQARGPVAPPQSGPLPILSTSSHTYVPPKRRILTPQDLEIFQSSPTHDLLVNFVISLNTSILDKPLSYDLGEVDSIITSLLGVLDKIEDLVKKNPRVDNGGSRFGNEGFKHFYDSLEKVYHLQS